MKGVIFKKSQFMANWGDAFMFTRRPPRSWVAAPRWAEAPGGRSMGFRPDQGRSRAPLPCIHSKVDCWLRPALSVAPACWGSLWWPMFETTLRSHETSLVDLDQCIFRWNRTRSWSAGPAHRRVSMCGGWLLFCAKSWFKTYFRTLRALTDPGGTSCIVGIWWCLLIEESWKNCL